MRVVVTGAAGMIGANLLRGLNAIGIDDIIAVDDLSDGAKYANAKHQAQQSVWQNCKTNDCRKHATADQNSTRDSGR